MSNRSQLLKGLVELAVLSALEEAPLYGLSLLDRLRDEAGLDVAEGSIYPLMHRLERSGVVTAQWVTEDSSARPRKYYALTAEGRDTLRSAEAEWLEISRGLSKFLKRQRK